MNIPEQCQNCPGANFVHGLYTEYSKQESLAMNVEAEAREESIAEVAELASSAVEKISIQRAIAEMALNSIQDCPGFDGTCKKNIDLTKEGAT